MMRKFLTNRPSSCYDNYKKTTTTATATVEEIYISKAFGWNVWRTFLLNFEYVQHTEREREKPKSNGGKKPGIKQTKWRKNANNNTQPSYLPPEFTERALHIYREILSRRKSRVVKTHDLDTPFVRFVCATQNAKTHSTFGMKLIRNPFCNVVYYLHRLQMWFCGRERTGELNRNSIQGESAATNTGFLLPGWFSVDLSVFFLYLLLFVDLAVVCLNSFRFWLLFLIVDNWKKIIRLSILNSSTTDM